MDFVRQFSISLAVFVIFVAVVAGAVMAFGNLTENGGASSPYDCVREEGLPGAAWGKYYSRATGDDWVFIGYCDRNGRPI